MNPPELSRKLKEKAFALGFELAGVAAASPSPDYPFFLEWISKGYAGEMGYLERRKQERGDPSSLLPGAKSVFCAGLSYNPQARHYPLLEKHPISCYAWGRDYHEVLWEKLESLSGYLCGVLVPGAKAKAYVDTGPVLERSYAAQAGLGWVGKNTLLLNKTFGSFLFLGEILTDAELEPDSPTENLCKTCTACLDACPVGALEEPGLLNATKCISYLTLEHRSGFGGPVDLHGYLAGCDLCQTVCPYNTNAPEGREPAFQPRPEILELTIKKASDMGEGDFRKFTRNSALERVKHPMWKRNTTAMGQK
ncbi:MAG TPA: tRNA epoxyqueuosine(34) reductase QueG [bacterium]|nr:tRNA epoxyqueuosine(34) reductase QueG [bacterium]